MHLNLCFAPFRIVFLQVPLPDKNSSAWSNFTIGCWDLAYVLFPHYALQPYSLRHFSSQFLNCCVHCSWTFFCPETCLFQTIEHSFLLKIYKTYINVCHWNYPWKYLNLYISSSFLLLWIQAASSFCGFKQLPPSVDFSSFLLLWIQAASSFRGLEQLPPSVDSTTSSNICPGAPAFHIWWIYSADPTLGKTKFSFSTQVFYRNLEPRPASYCC